MWYYYMPTGLYDSYNKFINEITTKDCKLLIPDLLYDDFKVNFIRLIEAKQNEQKNPPFYYEIHSPRLETDIKNKIKELPLTVKNGIMLANALKEIRDSNESYSKIINFICFFVGYLHNDSVYFYREDGKPNFGNNPKYGGENNQKIISYYFDDDAELRKNVVWCTPDGNAPVNNTHNQELGLVKPKVAGLNGAKQVHISSGINQVPVGRSRNVPPLIKAPEQPPVQAPVQALNQPPVQDVLKQREEQIQNRKKIISTIDKIQDLSNLQKIPTTIGTEPKAVAQPRSRR